MFTTLLGYRSCEICKHTAEEFQILADAWKHPSPFTNKVFFVMLDYDRSPEIFYMFQVTEVPNFFYLSAERTFTPDDIYYMDGRGFTAKEIGEWVAERMTISNREPINYSLFTLGIFLSLIGGLVCLLKWNRNFIFHRILWEFLTLCFVVVMISGQMWIYIKREPYVRRNSHTGHIHYISKPNYSQFVPETYIIALFNMCVTLGVLLLDKAARSRMDIIMRKLMCVSGVCLAAVSFSWLLSLFRFKVPDYPYRLLID
ncbi:magnesium transporter protein 1-like [Nycticebus coucang]|uniref:magnesium transporter protein 1-like n=1 Tax=Nycticebus coucang TaxID=9470 RepID=UPI00234C4B3F|nr:magnesium transporter protein 1-like [Nycticebus coucang]